MPASHKIDFNAKLIITTWEGEAVDQDFIDAIKLYQKNLQNKPEYIEFNEVVNFTKVTNIKLTINGLKKLGELASSTDLDKHPRKLAFIVSSTRAYGLVKLYEFYRNFSKKANKKIRAFINEHEAYDWLKIKE